MNRTGLLRMGTLYLACLGMILPTPVLHAATNGHLPGQAVGNPAAEVVDVELSEGGVLSGQVIDVDAAPPAGTVVSLRRMGGEIGTTVTDPSGNFRFHRVRAGTYQIVAGRARGLFRAWAPNTAPPLARPSALVLATVQSVRGNQGPIGYWLGKPWVVAGIVAGAVAVPVIIHNHRIQRASSP